MTESKQQLSKEDIQAIAQELKTLQESQNAKNGTNASACVKNKNAQNIQKLEGEKMTNHDKQKAVRHIKNVVNIGIILFWAIVLIVFLIKLAPYL